MDGIVVRLKKSKGSQQDDLMKASDKIKESLKSLTESATGTRPAKQVGAWSSFQVTAQSKVNEAQQTLRARLHTPSEQDVQRVAVAEQLTKEFTDKVDAFYTKDWRDYQSKVESAQLSWFK